MVLKADPLQPGLWVNPDWSPDQDGIFALIIGVSRYDHLDDGPGKRAEKTYGLGQLKVSALTALRFFEWLAQSYTLEGLPVAEARLLLSPLRKGDPGVLRDELDGCDPDILDHAPQADFLGCRKAVIEWHAAMRSQPSQRRGRSLFFFSGHGLEIRKRHQVLLPSDYLAPPGGILNDAISTLNLVDCLPYLQGIGSHVLMLDACRNDAHDLRNLKVQGADILNEELVGGTNPHYDQSVLYATTSGQEAYSPRDGGLSLYGHALLDGLRGRPDPRLDEPSIKLRRQGKRFRVEVDSLTTYIKGRVNALIKAAESAVVQSVRTDKSSAGEPVDLAEIDGDPPRRAPAARRSMPPETDPSDEGADMKEVLVHRPSAGALDPSGEGARARRPRRSKQTSWFRQRYPFAAGPLPTLPETAQASERANQLHALFGSEAITYPWLDTLRVTGLSGGRQAGEASVDILQVRHAAQSPELHRIQVHIQLKFPDSAGYLLEIVDPSGLRAGCVLPADRLRPRYQLEIDCGRGSGGQPSFLRFAGYLSSDQRGPLGSAARAWDRLRALNAAEAAEELGRHGFLRPFENMLRDKKVSPLAATIAATILLKAERFDLMRDWTRNLADRFPALSDGLVLWVEQSRRQKPAAMQDPELAAWFVMGMEERSLPFTAECFGMAKDILRDIARGRFAIDKRRTRMKALALAERLDFAMPHFRDAGLFSSYAAWPADLDLAVLIGPRANEEGWFMRPHAEPAAMAEPAADAQAEAPADAPATWREAADD